MFGLIRYLICALRRVAFTPRAKPPSLPSGVNAGHSLSRQFVAINEYASPLNRLNGFSVVSLPNTTE